MSFYSHLQACNNFVNQSYLPWIVNGQPVGLLRQGFVEHLKQWPDYFQVSAVDVRVMINPHDIEHNSHVFLDIQQTLVEQGVMGYLHGEQYVVTPDYRENGLFSIDRAAAAYFGVKAFGQHLNAYVLKDDGLWMWIGKRAKDRVIYPGKLDNLAAGGLPLGISLADNLAKEAYEEAGIPATLIAQAIPTGVITYNAESDRGYKPDTLYCYDLELPASFQPQCTDGEVDDFYLMPITEVMRLVRETDKFKQNCNLVIIDFLIRHGMITPEDPEYLALVQGLHPEFVF